MMDERQMANIADTTRLLHEMSLAHAREAHRRLMHPTLMERAEDWAIKHATALLAVSLSLSATTLLLK